MLLRSFLFLLGVAIHVECFLIRKEDAYKARIRLRSTPSSGLYEEQEDMLIRRGILEEELMQNAESSFLSSTKKTKSAGKGFGGSGSSSKNRFQHLAKQHAKTLRKSGVVRIDNVLTDELADATRNYVMELKDDRESAQFANVLLRTNRCDLKLPLSDTVASALYHVIYESPVLATIETILGDTGVLHELSCLISSPGSQRQVMHPDTPMLPNVDHPSLLTCFIALQDISVEMGATVYLPNTHNEASHKKFKDDKDELLKTTPHTVAVLPKGSCAVFDSRTLHCGTANVSNMERAIFYFSIRHDDVPNPGNPPSIRDDLKGLKVTELLDAILEIQDGK